MRVYGGCLERENHFFLPSLSYKAQTEPEASEDPAVSWAKLHGGPLEPQIGSLGDFWWLLGLVSGLGFRDA